MKRSNWRALALPLVLACGRPTDPVNPNGPPSAAVGSLLGESFSEWSAPVNVGSTVNSPFVDNLPELSRDGLSLYFASNRPGGSGALDLWVAQRASADAPWGAPVNLGPTVNSGGNDAAPNLSRDGHYLFITSNRPGGFGDNDLWVSWRADVHDDFAWEPPVNMGSPVSSPVFDAGAAFRQPEFYFTRGPSAGALDIYVSSATRHEFGSPEIVAELSSTANDQRPTLRFDRREIFLSSNRPGGLGGDDLWASERQSASAPWSVPVNLGPVVNTSYFDGQASLSEDATMLFFSSDRPGGSGGVDLWVTTRSRGPRSDG